MSTTSGRANGIFLCAMLSAAVIPAWNDPANAKEKPATTFVIPGKQGAWTAYRDSLLPPGGRYPSAHDPAWHLTKKDYLLILEKLDRVASILKQAAVLNPPMGFEVHPLRRIGEFTAYEKPPRGPITSKLDMVLPPYQTNCEGCRFVLEVEPGGFGVELNNIPSIYDAKPFRTDERGPMYLAPRVVGEVAGFPEYHTDFIVVTKIKRPLWLPVSQERFIRNETREFTDILKKAEAEMAKGSIYHQWLRERGGRMKDIEDTYKGIREFNPKRAEEYRSQALKTEKEVEERLKAEDQKNLEAIDNGISNLKRQVRALERELSSLSPAERAAPAYYTGVIHNRPSGLEGRDAVNARLIVETNPGFFNSGKPATSFQLLAVFGLTGAEEWLKGCEEDMKNLKEPPKVRQGASIRFDPCFKAKIRAEIRKTIHWKALEALLDGQE